MTLEFFGQIIEKYSNIKFHENLSNGSWVVQCRQMDKCDEAVTFRSFMNMPKIGWSTLSVVRLLICNYIHHTIQDGGFMSYMSVCLSKGMLFWVQLYISVWNFNLGCCPLDVGKPEITYCIKKLREITYSVCLLLAWTCVSLVGKCMEHVNMLIISIAVGQKPKWRK